MSLFDVIAREYTVLFPSSDEKLRFAEALIEDISARCILDIGCASGEFVHQLSRADRIIHGIDLDQTMISVAMEKTKLSHIQNTQFYCSDMELFVAVSSSRTYDAVFMMGNTLAYIENTVHLKSFLADIHRLLSPGGVCCLQLLNYTNRQFSAGFNFPVLESEQLRFYRSYKQSSVPDTLIFATQVEDRLTDEVIAEEHLHSCFTGSQIADSATECGFTAINIFGGYDAAPAADDDFFHVFVLHKSPLP